MELSEFQHTDAIFRRVGHITVPYRHFIIVWGGFVGEKLGSVSVISSYCPPDQLWFYNCLTDVWTLRQSSGEVPAGSSGSTAIVHDDQLYVFGGIEETGDGGWTYNNKLYRLDLRTLTWRRLVGIGRQPQRCDKSVGWYYKQRLYFFGGYGMRPSEPPYDYNYVIDNSESDRGWNNQFVCYDLVTNSWIKPKAARGTPPTPRAAHSADISGHFVYIFGGRTGEMRNNEMYCLDMDTMTWSHNLTGDVIGLVPTGRSWHTFNFISLNRAALYGGLLKYGMPAMDFWECTIDENQRVKWYLREKSTDPLCWHQAAFCSFTGDLVIVGGVSTSPYEMGEEDHVDSMVVISYQPKSLFRLSMDVILQSELIRFSPKLLERYFPKTLIQLILMRSSQKKEIQEEF